MNKNKSDKQRLLEALKDNHIVLAACRKVGVGKSNYYRWRQDPKFARAADAAIQEGIELVNDAAEGVVVGAIKERNLDGAKFFLKHNHPRYKDNIIRAGAVLAESEDGTILEIFATLKPTTRKLLAPYVKKSKKQHHVKN